MSRNAAAVGALVLVGGLLWLVTAWPTSEEDSALPEEPPEAPAPAAPAPEPEPAAQLPAPAIGTPPQEPEPAPAPPSDEPPPKIQPRVPDEDLFAKDQGPVDEYKKQYDSEPRDSTAHDYEKKIAASFLPGDGAPDMYKSVMCRKTTCKIELRWKPDRLGAYVAGLTRASVYFSDQVAVAAAPPAPDDRERLIDVYIKRKPVTTTELQPPAEAQQPPAAEAPAAAVNPQTGLPPNAPPPPEGVKN